MKLRPVSRMGVTAATRDLGETLIEGGFRRVSRLPEPTALARMRALLLDVAAGGGAAGGALAEGLAGFEEWRFLAALCEDEWGAVARRDSRAARRVLARRLRMLGTRPITLTAAATLPVGSTV